MSNFATLGFAGRLLIVLAALQVIAVVFAGLSAAALETLPWGLLAAVTGLGLTRGWRWLGWPALAGCIVGVGAVLGGVGASALPASALYALAALLAVAALSLFATLWRDRPAARFS
ncbi:hypothetical protein [Pseudooceanicola sp.]|uniref:hypothetical protein n=1 Tax=Pseudooceanicola sp. TaxID=1914328 RepID=UPI004059A3B4